MRKSRRIVIAAIVGASIGLAWQSCAGDSGAGLRAAVPAPREVRVTGLRECPGALQCESEKELPWISPNDRIDYRAQRKPTSAMR